MAWNSYTQGAHTTLFNTADGNRISFGPVPKRLRAPELLDVKLTDVCSVGCAYCYQDSRPDRGHARLEDVAFIALKAAEAGVFEVALGGGEVSEYPHFRAVLHLFRQAGIIPNFTTRRMRWLARHWAQFRELVGGVAVSVNSAAETRLLNALIPAAERREGQLVVQVVMGTVERHELLALVQVAGAANIRVTLLGFKDVGRGQRFMPLGYGWWLTDLREYVRHAQISIDTALASETPEELAALLLPGSYHTEEGRFSAYVDAVSMTLAPSSYHTGPAHPFGGDWLEAFALPDFVQGPRTPDVRVSPHALSRVRLGFATNSSSSHSLVLLAGPVADDPPEPAQWAEAYSTTWGTFIAATAEAKKHYLAANLARSAEDLYPGQPWDIQQAQILAVCDLPPSTDLRGYGVDHQSAIAFTRNPIWPGPHAGQFQRVKAALLSPDVAVFGHDDGTALQDVLEPPVQEQVRLELDGANFAEMLATPVALEPPPARQAGEDEALYALGIVCGERMKRTVQQVFGAGFDWEDVRLAFFDPEDHWAASEMPAEAQQDTLLSRLLAAAELPVHPSRRRDDQRMGWFKLYLHHGAEPVNAFLDGLMGVEAQFPALARVLWQYVLDHEGQLLAAQRALKDAPTLARMVGPDSWSSSRRIEAHLHTLSASP